MISHLWQRLGTAGFVISIVALVAALAGGAYAASNALTGKEKKEVKAIAKKVAKQGPQGPQGQPGPAGPKGDKGDPGTNGTNGTNGVNPTGTVFTGAKGSCTDGGVEFKDGDGNTTFACNGADGTTGFTETLPSEETETGAWSLGTTSSTGGPTAGTLQGFFIPISFNIPLETGLDGSHVHYIDTAGKEVLAEPNESFELEKKVVDQASPKPCPGTAAAPEAEPGHLCVYEAQLVGPLLASNLIGNPGNESFPPYPSANNGTGSTGALMNAVYLTEPLSPSWGWGTWAVTAE